MVKIAEIFRSTQGEGYNAGHAAIFIRLSGCNLKCPFCDTDHSGQEMDESDVAKDAMSLRKDADINLVIFTGGEPSLQMAQMRNIIVHMEHMGYIGTFACESNGTCSPLDLKNIGIDFVTISPKCLWVSSPAAKDKMSTWTYASEIKCLYDTSLEIGKLHGFLDSIYDSVKESQGSTRPKLYLQPVTDHDNPEQTEANIQAVLSYITCINSDWQISMQLQNIWNVR